MRNMSGIEIMSKIGEFSRGAKREKVPSRYGPESRNPVLRAKELTNAVMFLFTTILPILNFVNGPVMILK